METVMNEVVETTEKQSKNKIKVDPRTLWLKTKPYTFSGESTPRSEFIRIRAIDEMTYEKAYLASQNTANDAEARRRKVVKLNPHALPVKDIKNVEEYFDFLLKNRGYSCG